MAGLAKGGVDAFSVAAMRWLLLALLLLRPVVGWAEADLDARRLLDSGVTLYHQGDFRGALKLFTAAQALAPERANPFRWLGLAEARLGRCPEAVVNLDRFLGLVQPGDPRTAEVTAARDLCQASLAPTAAAVPTLAKPVDDALARPLVVAPPPLRLTRVPVYRRWWLWTALGVVVAGGVAATLSVLLVPARDQTTMFDAITVTLVK